MRRMIHPAVQGLVLALVALLPYVRGLAYEFVYDDLGSIAENPFLEEPNALRQVLAGRTLTDATVPDGRRPVVILTYLLDRAMWGVRPFGYHVTNLLLHAACVLLFFGWLRRLVPDRFQPFLPFGAALLFALHPVNIEAVQSPAFREDVLLCLFSLAFLWMALRPGWGAWPALPLFGLALGSKESAVAAVPLLWWTWACFPAVRPARQRRLVLTLGSFVLVVPAFAVWVKSGSLQAVLGAPGGIGLPFPQNLWTAPLLWLKALRLLAVPWPLVVDPIVSPVPTWTSPLFAAGLFLAVLGVTTALMLRARHPDMAFGLGWLVMAFAPASNLLPLFNPFAERYLYFMVPGAALLAAGLLARLPSANGRAGWLATLCAVFVALIALRLPDWSDNAMLWRRTLAREPRSARAYTWVGLDFKHRGDMNAARRMFEEADRLNPRDTSALINLAVLAGQEGRLEEAVEKLREATRRRPDKADGWWNLAVALNLLGRKEEAAEAVRRTLQSDPRHPAARAALALPSQVF